MRKMSKRITALVLAVLLFAGMTTGVMAAGEIYATTGTQVVYRSSTKGYTNVYVSLASSDSDFTMKRSGVKITKGKTGAKLYSFQKYTSSWEEESEYMYTDYSSGSEQWETYKYGNKTYGYDVGLMVNHSGTATVKYKAGGVAYTTKVKVLNYKNPVKKITLSGVKGGKNFASLTKRDRFVKELPLKANVSKATLKVAAAKGWKVSSINFREYDKKGNVVENKSIYCSGGLNAMQLVCGKLLVGHRYTISVSFVNTANGASVSNSYWINY